MSKRDLRAELLVAEAAARDRKRKAEGLPPLEDASLQPQDDESNKRRKLLQDALELDKDDDDEDDSGSDTGKKSKANGANEYVALGVTLWDLSNLLTRLPIVMPTTLTLTLTTRKTTRLNSYVSSKRSSANVQRTRRVRRHHPRLNPTQTVKPK